MSPSQVSSLESEQQQLLAGNADLEARLKEQSSAWVQLHGALQGPSAASGNGSSSSRVVLNHVPGREAEVGGGKYRTP